MHVTISPGLIAYKKNEFFQIYLQVKFENFFKTLLFEFLNVSKTLLFCSLIIFKTTHETIPSNYVYFIKQPMNGLFVIK